MIVFNTIIEYYTISVVGYAKSVSGPLYDWSPLITLAFTQMKDGNAKGGGTVYISVVLLHAKLPSTTDF